jgi:hypothetical protein
MTMILIAPFLAAGLLLGMLLLLEIGRRVGARRLAQDPDGARTGAAPIEGAVFGLLGLLIAFTFSGAATRFDTRRHLIVEEANDIGTAYLRLDLLPPESQPPLRDLFRRYLDTRLEAYGALPDTVAAKTALDRAAVLQGEIWNAAVVASRGSSPATMLLLPALNQMIDITSTRLAGMRMHPPTVVFLMLSGLTLLGSLLAGYGMAASKKRGWIHMLVFATVMAASVYLIVDLEFPRAGLIRVTSFDQVLVDVRQTMK